MVRTITPFNLLPIYSGLPDRAARAGLYCPTTKGPMFQFYRAGGLAVNSFETYNAATGSATTQDAAQIEVSETATGTFFTYKGDTLDVAMSQGQEYHFRVTLSDDTVYYSHLLCPLSAFDAAAITLAVSSCVSSSGAYSINLLATIPAGAGYRIVITDNNGTDTAIMGAKAFTIDETFGTDVAGGMSIKIEIYANVTAPNGGSIEVYRRYRLTFPVASPCTTTLTDQATTITADETLHVLRIDNDGADKQPLQILHQTGFIQELYFVGFDEAPTPVQEQSFVISANGTPVFQGAALRTAYPLSFWPCPDEVAAALDAQTNSKGISVEALAGDVTEAVKMTVTRQPVTNDNVQALTLTFEVDAVRVERCEDDYVLTA